MSISTTVLVIGAALVGGVVGWKLCYETWVWKND